MNGLERELPELVLANLKRKRDAVSSEDEFVIFREEEDSSDSEVDLEIKSSSQKKRRDVGDEDKHESQWNDRFERLKEFKNLHGHLYVPRKTEKQLNRWCITQRAYKRDTKLSQERIQKLNSIGFQWGRSDSRQTEWDKQFEKMKSFIEKHGHSSVPVNKDKKLNKWVEKQRASRKNGCMNSDRIQRLESIGFQWQGRDFSKDWQHNYDLLRSFKESNGHIECAVDLPDVSKWLAHQISLFKKGVLSAEKAKRLESIGVCWFEMDEKEWEMYYQLVMEFYSKFGHSNIPEKSFQLYSWCNQQREYKQQGKLKHSRVMMLQKLDFAWYCNSPMEVASPATCCPQGSPKEPIDQEWLQNFRQLEYNVRSIDTSLGFPMIEKNLYFWLRKQMSAKEAGELSEDQLHILETLNLWNCLVSPIKKEEDDQGSDVRASMY